MKSKQLNTAFLVTIGVSVLVFIYLVFLGYDEIKTLKDIIKIIASILFPLPLLFFTRFILIEHFLPKNTNEYKLKNQKPATLLLLFTVIVFICFMQLIEYLTGQKLEDHLIFAHLINSTTISSYVLNYLLYNNLKVNGILSGILLSLAIHVFFLSV
ncbi:hypothetical protein C7H62_0407 [Mesoflavibacter sp. HG96]|uniref:hypothetical protein n=1 Tax=Mesoflavibacter TaxID=444051 RepID=UPI000D0F5A58|nr:MULTISPECIES: hypothetical protein [Mesoflavibacter]QIJ88216.1 hypothetical protein C7H62_0407 [Mesoflavibacter sp. HG96]QIJ90944.1 hypothetical protein C7H56_0407 [Mesoflavibacter sp. HG37]